MSFLADACWSVRKSQSKVSAWIFDFDNTLFFSGKEIFPLINEKMTEYIEQNLLVDRDEANRLRSIYWVRYGATMTGLVRHHGVNARHFLKKTHEIGELQQFVSRSSRLVTFLKRLPGKKIVFSNSPSAYLDRLLKLLEIKHFFDDTYSIESTKMYPKPARNGYLRLLKEHKLEASRCVMVEDSLVNLVTARKLGMKTIWVTPRIGRSSWVDARISKLY